MLLLMAIRKAGREPHARIPCGWERRMLRRQLLSGGRASRRATGAPDERAAAARQAEADFYPVLLLFGEAPGGARADGEAQAALAAALPALRALGRLLGRLEAAAASLLGQLGALCCAQTRKATILQGAPLRAAPAAHRRRGGPRAGAPVAVPGDAHAAMSADMALPDRPPGRIRDLMTLPWPCTRAQARTRARPSARWRRRWACWRAWRRFPATTATCTPRSPRCAGALPAAPPLGQSCTGRGVRVVRPDHTAAKADARLGQARR